MLYPKGCGRRIAETIPKIFNIKIIKGHGGISEKWHRGKRPGMIHLAEQA